MYMDMAGIVRKQEMLRSHEYGSPEGTFLFQYLPEKKLKQNELEKKSEQ